MRIHIRSKMRSLNIYFRHSLLPSGQSSGVFYSIISFCFLIQRLVVSNSCTGPPYISFTKLQGLASAALCCNSLPCSMRISWQIAPNPSTFSCVMPMFLLLFGLFWAKHVLRVCVMGFVSYLNDLHCFSNRPNQFNFLSNFFRMLF